VKTDKTSDEPLSPMRRLSTFFSSSSRSQSASMTAKNVSTKEDKQILDILSDNKRFQKTVENPNDSSELRELDQLLSTPWDEAGNLFRNESTNDSDCLDSDDIFNNTDLESELASSFAYLKRFAKSEETWQAELERAFQMAFLDMLAGFMTGILKYTLYCGDHPIVAIEQFLNSRAMIFRDNNQNYAKFLTTLVRAQFNWFETDEPILSLTNPVFYPSLFLKSSLKLKVMTTNMSKSQANTNKVTASDVNTNSEMIQSESVLERQTSWNIALADREGNDEDTYRSEASEKSIENEKQTQVRQIINETISKLARMRFQESSSSGDSNEKKIKSERPKVYSRDFLNALLQTQCIGWFLRENCGQPTKVSQYLTQPVLRSLSRDADSGSNVKQPLKVFEQNTHDINWLMFSRFIDPPHQSFSVDHGHSKAFQIVRFPLQSHADIPNATETDLTCCRMAPPLDAKASKNTKISKHLMVPICNKVVTCVSCNRIITLPDTKSRRIACKQCKKRFIAIASDHPDYKSTNNNPHNDPNEDDLAQSSPASGSGHVPAHQLSAQHKIRLKRQNSVR